ncbi:MAG: undecaprenyl-diphosphate phosphatase [Bacillota bacterium]
MDIFQAIIYGIVQGIGEFLPISSTAHLDLLPWFAGWQVPPSYFNMALHFGTLIAVVVFFFKDWVNLVVAGFTKPKSGEGKFFWLIALATIPAAIVGLTIDKYAEALGKNHLLTGIMLIVMGVVLYVADKYGKVDAMEKSAYEGHHNYINQIGFVKGLLVGIAQTIAIIPGVSRSGITMSMGRFLGMSREKIARFSFMLATPIIFADAVFQLKDIGKNPPVMVPFIVAILTSAVVGMISIKFLLNYLKTKGFGVFVIYRFALGAVVIIMCILGR